MYGRSDCFCKLFYMLSMIALTLSQYNISYYSNILSNPSQANHAIPIEVWYPNMTIKESRRVPILVFGHCLFSPPEYYDYIWKTLVPKGYIVVLPTGDRWSGLEKELAKDIRFTLDWIYDNCSQSISCPFNNIIGNKSIVSGHSEGAGSAVWCIANSWLGQTFNHTFDSMMTLSVCGQNTSDGSSTFSAAKNITSPVFIMDGSHDCTCSPDKYADVYFNIIPNNNNKCKYEGIITNGTHCDFADLTIAQDKSCIELEEAECTQKESHLTVKQQNQITVKYMDLFMNATLYNYNNKNKFDILNKQIQNDMKNGVMFESKSNNCN